MIKEDRLCKLRRRIYMRLYFNTEISTGETKVITKSCKVTTIVNTNHFPQNLKKRYWSSLAIVVPQSGSLLRSGDRLFEWLKLSGKKRRNERSYGEIYNSTSTQTCVLRYTEIFSNLFGWTCIFCISFALQGLFDDFNHL